MTGAGRHGRHGGFGPVVKAPPRSRPPSLVRTLDPARLISPRPCSGRTYFSNRDDPEAEVRRRSSFRRVRLPERAERGAQFPSEKLRLFPRGEVAAPVDLVEVGEIGV